MNNIGDADDDDDARNKTGERTSRRRLGVIHIKQYECMHTI